MTVAAPLPLDRLPPAGWPAIRPVRVHGRDRWQVDERPHGGRHVHATEERARAAAHVARRRGTTRTAVLSTLTEAVIEREGRRERRKQADRLR